MKTPIWIDTCISMFITVLVTIAKILKQYNCLLIDVYTHHVYMYMYTHAHTMEYYSVIGKKKEGNSASWDSMGGPQGHYTKWNKSGKAKYHIISYVWNQNKWTNQT